MTINKELNAPNVWAYPVRQGVLGGDPITIYFRTAEQRNEYCANHDHCDKLPRCKIEEELIREGC